MAVSKKDANRVPSLIGVSSADGSTPTRVYVDPDTNRLYVDVALSGVTDLTGVTDGEAVNVADKGVLLMGTDGSNYQVFSTDSSGNLNVNATVTGSQSVALQQKVTTNDLIVTLDSESVAVTNAGITTIAGAVAGTEMQVDVVTMPTTAVTGTFWQATQPVSAAALPLPTGAATEATLGTIDTDTGNIVTAVQIIDDVVYVDDADWTADTSSHILVGGVTQATPTANTDGDTTPLITNSLRELRVAVPESDLATAGTSHVKKYYTSAGAVTDGIIWSPAAGKRWYVTDIFIQVSAAATVTLEDDLAAGDSAIWKAELAANSGWSHAFTTPWFSGEDAADLIITTSAGNVYVSCVGYEI